MGVDASATMVRQALRRNRAAVRQGRVEIVRADAARLPFPDGHFSKAGSLNSFQFWPAPDQGLAELCRVLEPGGRVAVVLMARSDEPTGVAPRSGGRSGPTPRSGGRSGPDPRSGGRSGPESPPWVDETVGRMQAAGFDDLVVASRTFGGVLHRALVGTRREKKSGAPLDPTADGVRKGAGT